MIKKYTNVPDPSLLRNSYERKEFTQTPGQLSFEMDEGGLDPKEGFLVDPPLVTKHHVDEVE